MDIFANGIPQQFSHFKKFFAIALKYWTLYLLEISKCGILTGVCAVKRVENIWGCHLSLEEIICVRDNPLFLPCSIKISWMPWHFFKCNLLTFDHRMDWSKWSPSGSVTKMLTNLAMKLVTKDDKSWHLAICPNLNFLGHMTSARDTLKSLTKVESIAVEPHNGFKSSL